MIQKIHNWIRIPAIFVTALLTLCIFNMERAFDYKSWWTLIMFRGTYADQINSCLKCFLLIAFIGAIVMYVISIASGYYEIRLILDRIAGIAVITGIVLVMVLTMFLYRGSIVFDNSRGFLLLSGIMLIVVIGHFITGSRLKKMLSDAGPIEDKGLEEDKNKKLKIVKCINVLYVVIMLIPVIISLVIYVKFLPNYGILGSSPLSYSEEIEEKYMNFFYDGVSIGDDLYFLSENGDAIDFYQGSTGEITSFFENDIFYYDIDSDGTYLYVCGFDRKHNSIISRIAIATGEYEELFCNSQMQIHGIALREGMIYYYAEMYGEDGKPVKNTIFCTELADSMNFDNAKIYVDYLSDLYLSFNNGATLYSSYVGGNPTMSSDGFVEMSIGTGRYITKFGEYYYNIALRDTSHYSSGNLYRYPAYLIRYKEGDDDSVIMDNAIATEVTAYNKKGDKLYYAVATDDGLEIYESDLDGGNRKCIETRTDGTRVKALFVTENHILYSYSNGYLSEIDEFIGAVESVSIN